MSRMSGVNLNAITGLFPGKSLCVFTTGGEYRFVNDQAQAITPTSAPQNQTQYGSAHIKPIMIDGNVIFVQRNLKSLRDFQFDYTVDQFNSLGISALCPNLIYNVQDIAVWQGSVDDEINLMFVVNGSNPSTDFDKMPDYNLAVYNTRKEVGTQAWVDWQSQANFHAVGCVVQNVFALMHHTLRNAAGGHDSREADREHVHGHQLYCLGAQLRDSVGTHLARRLVLSRTGRWVCAR